jgi:2',3'-cyclic-nucleotide 2'-phosphodiesterase (5'-nucleotidase family)
MLQRYASRAAAAIAAILLSTQTVAAQSRGKAVLLGINDVYQIEGVDNATSGGLARVRALRVELEKTAPDLLLLHAGDFLSPSLPGRIFAGAQMIDLMNIMDGNPAVGVRDPRMFVAFGNHEFDDTHCSKDGPLTKLVASSEFTWLSSNLDFAKCDILRPLATSPSIARSRIVKSGGLRIGLYSVTLSYPNYAAIVLDPIETSCKQIAELRAKGVDAVVALTHLGWRTDLELLGLGADGKDLSPANRRCLDKPDVVIGGHDHNSLSLPAKAPKLFKADADAASAWVIELTKTKGGPLKIASRLVRLDTARAADPLAQRVTNQWITRHDERFCLNECIGVPKDDVRKCRSAVEQGACLKEPLARTKSPIQAEEITIRSFETGFGNWIADQIRIAGAADVAFLNSGSIRLNYNLSAGTMLTRRHLEQLFPFKIPLVVREVPGRDIWRALQHAVANRGDGPWAHFSGMAVQLNVEKGQQTVSRIVVRRADGSKLELKPDTMDLVKIASASFVLANGDGHGFKLCAGAASVPACMTALEATTNWPQKGAEKGEGADLGSLIGLRLRALAPDRELDLPLDRRLCDPSQSGCLIATW